MATNAYEFFNEMIGSSLGGLEQKHLKKKKKVKEHDEKENPEEQLNDPGIPPKAKARIKKNKKS